MLTALDPYHPPLAPFLSDEAHVHRAFSDKYPEARYYTGFYAGDVSVPLRDNSGKVAAYGRFYLTHRQAKQLASGYSMTYELRDYEDIANQMKREARELRKLNPRSRRSR